MRKILIIDDESDVRAVLKARLMASHFQVLEAEDGPSGVARAKEEGPDLILLDILMPGQDGVETYHALQQDPATKGIPVIFLTALAEDVALTKKSLELERSCAILGKPYQPQELIREIELALEKKG